MPLTLDMGPSIVQIGVYLYGGYPDPVTNDEQLSFLFSLGGHRAQ
jgi:hypothetical protein